MNDAYRTPIICSTGRGIGADFWRRYKGPTESMSYVVLDGYFENTRRPVAKTFVCVDCGRTFVRYRCTAVRCRPCQDERMLTRQQERDAARKTARTP